MMRCLLVVLMFLALSRGVVAAGAEGPLEMAVPAGWRVEYKADNGVDFYSVTPPSAGAGLLMFFKWPPPTKPEEIPGLVQKLADGFVKATKRSGTYTLTSKSYEVEPLAGEHCTGNHAAFLLKSGENDLVQGMFIVSVDGQVWNGQFTGQPENWLETIKLLKTIKRKS